MRGHVSLLASSRSAACWSTQLKIRYKQPSSWHIHYCSLVLSTRCLMKGDVHIEMPQHIGVFDKVIRPTVSAIIKNWYLYTLGYKKARSITCYMVVYGPQACGLSLLYLNANGLCPCFMSKRLPTLHHPRHFFMQLSKKKCTWTMPNNDLSILHKWILFSGRKHYCIVEVSTDDVSETNCHIIQP